MGIYLYVLCVWEGIGGVVYAKLCVVCVYIVCVCVVWMCVSTRGDQILLQ